VARLERFELPTHEVEARCSNPLSYSRIWYPSSDSNRETYGTPFERADFTKICLEGQIEFVSSCPIVIATIHPCNKLERDSVRHLGFIQSASFTGLRRSRQVGVEPKTFYCTVPSKNTEQRDFTC
jgi:hypothetical protein